MLNHRIERDDWSASFDSLTAGHAGVPGQATARLQVGRPDDEVSREAVSHDRAWLPFVGVTWQPKRDTITVALDGLDHLIEDPLVVWAEDPLGGHLQRLLILGAHGRRDEVDFKMAGLHG